MDQLVLDAQPLVALIAGEPTAPVIRDRITEALGSDQELRMSAANWCEVLYMTRRLLGEAPTHRTIQLVGRLPVSIVDVDAELATYAAEVKARFGLGLGSSFAAGLALALGAPLLTGDADFLPLAEHGLEIDWVGTEQR